ncbi:MAG: hypothetical protein ACI9S9_004392 [Planctomycetota bacterium]|jgi:hypothetical protein
MCGTRPYLLAGAALFSITQGCPRVGCAVEKDAHSRLAQVPLFCAPIANAAESGSRKSQGNSILLWSIPFLHWTASEALPAT